MTAARRAGAASSEPNVRRRSQPTSSSRTKRSDGQQGPRRPDSGTIQRRIDRWRLETLPNALQKLGMPASDVGASFVSPLAISDFDYLRDVGLPGEFPFTSWLYPTRALNTTGADSRLHRAGRYSGYGTSEDCRD